MFRTVAYGESAPENHAASTLGPRRRQEEVHDAVDEERDRAEDPARDPLRDLVPSPPGGCADDLRDDIDWVWDVDRDCGDCHHLEPSHGVNPSREACRSPLVAGAVPALRTRCRTRSDGLAPRLPVTALPHEVEDRRCPSRLRRGDPHARKHADIPHRDPRPIWCETHRRVLRSRPVDTCVEPVPGASTERSWSSCLLGSCHLDVGASGR